MLTLVEATLEDPWAVLYRQTDTLKGRALAAMKADGMEYEERMAELDKIEYPREPTCSTRRTKSSPSIIAGSGATCCGRNRSRETCTSSA